MFKNEFIKHGENLYVLRKRIKEEYKPNIELWKAHLGADTVLKKDDLLYFVELIPEAEIIVEDTILVEDTSIAESVPEEEIKPEPQIEQI